VLGDWYSIFGTLPGWITSAGVLSILGIIVRWHLGQRKLQIEAQQVEVNALGVRNTDEADIRDHYAEEVKQLREQLNGQGERHRNQILAIEQRHREQMDAAERRHDDCVKIREELRDQVSALKDLVAGLRRVIVQASASQAISIAGTKPGEVPEDILAAALRVEEVFRPKPEDGDNAR